MFRTKYYWSIWKRTYQCKECNWIKDPEQPSNNIFIQHTDPCPKCGEYELEEVAARFKRIERWFFQLYGYEGYEDYEVKRK